AMIALPVDMRERYVLQLEAQMPQTCSCLLNTLEYDQHLLEVPPFSVSYTWRQRVMSEDWDGGQDALQSIPKALTAGLERMD
ncbi:thiopurine S-methyltransferase, partial [Pseudomonas syringae pv. tagetis]